MAKDPQCPLGFHPQVRWPTRCKRCFREFKEHAVSNDSESRHKYDTSSTTQSTSKNTDDDFSPRRRSRVNEEDSKDFSSPYSSISSTALERLKKYKDTSSENKKSSVSVVSETLTLPSGDGPLVRRRRTTDLSEVIPDQEPSSQSSVTIRLRKDGSFESSNETSPSSSSPSTPEPQTSPSPPVSPTPDPEPLEQNTTAPQTTEASSEKDKEDSPAKPKKMKKKKRLLIQGVQEVAPDPPQEPQSPGVEDSPGLDSSADVAFIIQVKSKGRKKRGEDDDETTSLTTATDTTETTLIDLNETLTAGMSSWEVEEMKTEVSRLREKCDKLEKEKAEILSRRVASLDSPRVQSSEYTKLQQKVNQLQTLNEDLKDEQKHLELRVQELESELSGRPSADFMQRTISELRSKLTTAENQIDNLQEEKQDAIRQMKDMQEEFEELQDSFRDDQAEEYASLKKELEEATKNCRLLQFKLRKVEKRFDQVEAEKKELEERIENSSSITKISKLEEELKKVKLENEKLIKSKDKDLLSANSALKKKSPVLTKAPSGEKVEPPMPPDFDPHKTLRDLQSALESESDIREQLKFSEEECNTLRQKISRLEDENESLLIQIKKVTKSKTEPGKLKPDSKKGSNDIGDKLDPVELKVQLDLNEQESKILRKKVEELEKANNKLQKDLQSTEDRLASQSTEITKSKNVDEVTALRRKLIEKEREIERLQNEVSTKPKGKMLKSKSLEVQESNMRLDTETKAELKKTQEELSSLKKEAEKQRKELEDELQRTKEDLASHQARIQQVTEANKHLIEQIDGHKHDLKTMKQHYEEIQEDFAIKNSQLSTAKEDLEASFQRLKEEYDTIDRELKTLRETFNNRQDTWIKEKLQLEQKIRDIELSHKKLMSIPGDREATKLKSLLKQQQSDLDTRTKDLSDAQEKILQLQKENEDVRRQLEDFDKVAQVQLRSLSKQPSQTSEKDLKALQEKLVSEQKQHKAELAQAKLKHDQQLAAKSEEISVVQSQLSRAKRERDTFRQMVDSAQRAIAELKSRGGPKTSVSGLEEAATGAQAAMSALQDRVSALEDELAEAKRETSHVKTEMVTEKSQWEMEIGELQQKINELEEEKMLTGSGRSRGSSALGRTRLELAWQKERDEQQRRLKEATTLARDLKTTLLDIERERDRERTESKRRIDQLKSAFQEEQEDVKRKLSESQCDLLELRDAHAKLRTANEKLRKDRERLETQREQQIKRELEIRKVRGEREKVLDQLISKVSALNPTASNQNLAQQPPKMTFAEVLHFLQIMKSLTEPEDLSNPRERRRSYFKKASSLGESESDLPRSRESLASMPGGAYGLGDYYGAAGRAMKPYFGSVSSSTITLPSSRTRAHTPGASSDTGGSNSRIRSNASDSGTSAAMFNPKGSLYRKAVSLEQTVAMPDEQKIWKGTSEAGSGSSFASDGQFSRGNSVERTLYQKNEKSTGLVGKMKKLVKSKSNEEPNNPGSGTLRIVKPVPGAGIPGSDTSLNETSDSSTIKNKVKGIFRKRDRSPSTERKGASAQQLPANKNREPTPQRDKGREVREKTPSAQRPLMPSAQRPLMPPSYR